MCAASFASDRRLFITGHYNCAASEFFSAPSGGKPVYSVYITFIDAIPLGQHGGNW
jgi:hypothetical protein